MHFGSFWNDHQLFLNNNMGKINCQVGVVVCSGISTAGLLDACAATEVMMSSQLVGLCVCVCVCVCVVSRNRSQWACCQAYCSLLLIDTVISLVTSYGEEI